MNEIQTNAPGGMAGTSGGCTLEMLAGGGKYPPSSNHNGAYLAGAGFAALAIKGDPGANGPRLDSILKTVESSLRRLFTQGFGDGGWFGEGAGSDTTASQPGVVALMQSLRVAAGQDWCAVNRPNARMVVLTRVLELVPSAGEVSRPVRGQYSYGTRFSSRALVCTGLGALPEKYHPGLVWVYENFFEPGKKPEERIYEATMDPIYTVYAFVNWPIDKPAANPTGVLPLAVHDSVHGYVLCRNRFKDGKDCLFTGLARRGPTGYHKERAPQRVDVWGLGLRTTMGMLTGDTSHWQPGMDGSACFTIGGVSWAVDYSGASGATALIANVGGAPGKETAEGNAKATAKTLTLGGRACNLLILTENAIPDVEVGGEKIVVGGQTIVCDGKQITLGKFTPAK